MAEGGDDEAGPAEGAFHTIADTPRTRATAKHIAQLPARFTIKGPLGEGGMGTVLEAYDRTLLRDVAIKVLAKEHLEDPNVGTRFLREARAAARLRHPGIVQVHDIDPEGGFIVMELVRGESLSQRLWRDKKLPADEVRRIGSAVLAALGAAHHAGIVHRDVKPANVLLGETGEVKLADFGVAYFGDSDLTMPGTRVGTPAYMAPEQLRGKDIDARADVYSAGVTLFEAATGERPDDGADYDPYQKLVDATGDTVLAEAVRKAIRERPADRFANGSAFLAALEVTVAPTPPPRAKARAVTFRKPASRWPIAAVGAVAAVAIAVAAYALSTKSNGTDAPARPAEITPYAHRTIALLPFTDETKNPRLDFARAGLPNLLGIELRSVPDLTVIGYYQLAGVAGTDAKLEGWRDAARTLHADLVVRGTVTGNTERVHIAIDVDTASGEHVSTIERDASVEDIPETVRRTTGALVRSALGRDVAEPASPATSFDAERELQLGIADLEREHLPEASEHLYAAIRHAPDLALAHYYLAVALSWSAPPAETALAEVDKAKKSGQLDEAQLGVLAGVSKIAVVDYRGAALALEPVLEKYPDNRDVLYTLFEATYHGGDPAKAMTLYHRINAIAPKFRLALIHVLTYTMSHGDDAGMKWALEMNQSGGEDYSAVWEPRGLVAKRDYAGAIKLLSTQLERGDRRDLQSELVIAYALADQIDLAWSLATSLGEQNVNATAPALLGLAMARGDEPARKRWFEVAVHASQIEPPGPSRGLPLALLASAIGPARSHADLATLAKALDAAVPDDPIYERSVTRQLAKVVIADELGDKAKLEELAKAPNPEVAELAKGALARGAGDHVAAAAAYRRSIEATGDARFLVLQWWRVAGELRAAGDKVGAQSACDDALRPRLFATWAWGAAAGDCLAWSAEAQESAGKFELAHASWQRLAKLRSAAPPNDPLVMQARAALDRLR